MVFYADNNLMKAKLNILQKQNGAPSLVTPAATRWSSLGACLKSVLKNENFLTSFVNERTFTDGHNKSVQIKNIMLMKNLVNNDHFVTNLNTSISLLEPLDKYIIKFQSNSTTVSDVYYVFEHELPFIYKAMDLNPIQVDYVIDKIRLRIDLIYGNAHGVVYLLDPIYCGLNMDEDLKDTVENVIFTYGSNENEPNENVFKEYNNFIIHINQIKAQSRFKYNLLTERKMSVMECWEMDSDKWPLLKQVATNVCI